MIETKELITIEEERDLSLEVFGKQSDIDLLAKRIQVMLPGGDKLTTEQCFSLAQYSILTGANPFRGEIYAIPLETDKATGKATKIALDDGYKLLVRWAKAKCEYSEWYKPLAEGLNQGDVGFTCYILRQDKQQLLTTFVQGGMDMDRAMDICTVSAVGVVRYGESHYKWDGKYHKKGDPVDPPTGWTWDQVAKKRALKNALNLSHGAPSLAEIARESWNIHGIQTQPEDWQDTSAQMLPAEAEATAEYNARLRQIHEGPATVESAREAIGDLFGPAAAQEFSEAEFVPVEPPPQEAEDAPDIREPEVISAPNGDRPYEPQAIKAKLGAIVQAGSGAPATEAQRGLVASKLEECFAGQEDADKKRHTVLEYLFGSDSVKDLKQGHVDAILRWILLSQQKDETGDYPLHPKAPAEAAGIVKAALEDAGQQALF